jgi:pyruvate/2-oxoglutarate dehydrogenase complex dihydrolipoamide dehydrogenase (E3) component
VIAGLADVPFLTYKNVFDADRLPRELVVIGGGPLGAEIAQAYRRLGAGVTIVTDRLLAKEEPEASEVLRGVFECEGIRFVWGRADAARRDAEAIVVSTDRQAVRGDVVLIAAGRTPVVDGLDLEHAGVRYSEKGIPVDDRLRTNVDTVYAAGDVVGGPQFSHFAGYQAFYAVRNALIPVTRSGQPAVVPRVTFTDPEVGQVGLTEAQARARFGDGVRIGRWEMGRTDRAVCENDPQGFVKLIARRNGHVLGATVVCRRAGEVINELATAVRYRLTLGDLAGTVHAYPTYSTAVQQLATQMVVAGVLSGTSGKIIRGLSRMARLRPARRAHRWTQKRGASRV